jgi:hypothetical protein
VITQGDNNTRDLITLARRVVRGDSVDPGELCRAAIAAVDNPPEDPDLKWIADHLIDAAFSWARFNGSRLRLATAVRAYTMAASALAVDERRSL